MEMSINKPRFILTDIEGTTTSKSFVYDILFPYFIEHINKIEALQHEDGFREGIQMVKETMKEENINFSGIVSVIEQLKTWVEEDRKHPGLKKLQGLLWENGYKSGGIKGKVYSDVPSVLEKWKNESIDLGVYSSGSVHAQKLLFGHTSYGDLCIYFKTYFDTTVGHKREEKSYREISNQLGLAPYSILFLSDIEEELDAAQNASMQTIQLVRDETTLPSKKHLKVTNFNEIKWK